jgi:murein DD-endopeptidase MepM/ murein hydrolase activator NlpD
MNHNTRRRQILVLGLGILLLAVLACSEAEQAPVKTAVAQAALTALAEGKKAAGTEVAHLMETAQVAGATAAYSALQTVMANLPVIGSNGIPQFQAPVSGAGITASATSDMHTGPDLYAMDYAMKSEGTGIYPTLPGIIVYSGCEDPDYGCAVVIRHQNPSWNTLYYSIYAHMQTGSILPKDTLVDGTKPIGTMGQTGTGGAKGGIHLHFAVRTSDQVQEGLVALYGHDGQAAFDFRPYMP